jgi:hypothetical protein
LSLRELVKGLGPQDLRQLTDEMVDGMLKLIAGCEDADVTFIPDDPDAHDPAAADESDLDLAWTLGHVIVHTTATSEEAAAIAAELARGVEHRGGRSRSEVPWQSMKTIAACRHRLEESRRMRLASLEMWPDEPHLANTYPGRSGKPVNAVYRFVRGLFHDDSHLNQIAKIVDQAKSARTNASNGT